MKQFAILVRVLAATLSAPVVAQERNIAGEALGGAAHGAIIAGDAGKGAAAGAVVSLLFGEMLLNQ